MNSSETLHGLFGSWVRRRPDALAVVHGGERLTYEALDALSGHLAAQLEEAGVEPGDIVPVIMPRSARFIVALLAILKRGAAYAALDPRWPPQRLAELIRRTAPRVVVTDDAGFGWPVLAAPREADFGRIIRSRCYATPIVVTGEHPSTVFFTSGTTGEPKGAISLHQGTVRLFHDCQFADLGPDTVMPLAAAVAWDALSLELWSVLINGGTSVIVDEPYLLPSKLRELIKSEAVNTISLTSSLFNLFVDEDPAAFDGVRQVFVGGERVSAPHMGRFLAAHPRIRLVHCYGPVESTIFTTTHGMTPDDCVRPEGIPIGRPVSGTDVHILDGTRLCGPDEIGELVISGSGLVRGYLGAPDLTDQCFVTLSIDGVDRRVYRTGDLAHRASDGLIYFDGRNDRQVKIRGHRVEPAEIERMADRLPWIQRCVAVPVPAADQGYRSLALFYSTDETLWNTDSPVSPGEALREHLSQLPSYLIPQRLVQVSEFPMTDNGKINVKALLALADHVPATPSEAAADAAANCADPVESVVAATFAAILGKPDPAPDGSFFELGGDSLGLGRLATRLSSAVGFTVPISIVARRPTIAAVTQWIHDREIGDAGISTADATFDLAAPVPLSGMQAFFWSKYHTDPNDKSFLCLMGWEIDGPFDHGTLREAVADVHARHEALRAAYRLHGDEAGGRSPVAWVSDGLDRPTILMLPDVGDESDRRAQLLGELAQPLALDAGEVWRTVLLPCKASGRTLLGISVHHAAFDAWSKKMLLRDICHSYNARVAGQAPVFPDIAPSLAQVRDERQRELAVVDLAGQRQYWRRQLSNLPTFTFPAPGNAGVGAGLSMPTGFHSFQLSPADLAELDALANRHHATRLAALLAVWAYALGTTTGQSDFAIGVPNARRGTAALESAVGCLMDTLCVRIDQTGCRSHEELVGKTHRTLLDGVAAQEVSLGELRELLPPSNGAGQRGLFQTLFLLEDPSERRPLSFGAATALPLHLPRRRAPFELIIETYPEPDGTASVELTYQGDRVAGDFVALLSRTVIDMVRAESGRCSSD